jgi:hypothetical protein
VLSRARYRGRAGGHRCLAPGDDLERSWLEAVDYLAEPRHPFPVAGEGTPTPDGRHIRPWAEADERLRVFQVAEEQRGSFESFAVAPIDPLAPTPDELDLDSSPHAPGRVRVRLLHEPLPLAVAPMMTALTKNAGCRELSRMSRKAARGRLLSCAGLRCSKSMSSVAIPACIARHTARWSSISRRSRSAVGASGRQASILSSLTRFVTKPERSEC